MNNKSNVVALRWEEVGEAIENKQDQPALYDRYFIGSISKHVSVPVQNRKRSQNSAGGGRCCYNLGKELGSVFLTRREVQVLYYICTGFTNIQAAHKMDLSPRTIEYYIKNMRKKTNTLSKRHLVSQVVKSDFLQKVEAERVNWKD